MREPESVGRRCGCGPNRQRLLPRTPGAWAGGYPYRPGPCGTGRDVLVNGRHPWIESDIPVKPAFSGNPSHGTAVRARPQDDPGGTEEIWDGMPKSPAPWP
ncbi:hypothetical protein JCM13580A_04860 [Streptomyces drozdowiczii]